MLDVISAVIAGVSTLIAVAVYRQTKKGWHVSILAPQRLEWAENVRVAVSAFISAFYKNEDLRSHRARILLYLNPSNKSHFRLINAVNDICNGEDFEVEKVISATQEILRWNWWIAKSETDLSLSEEIQRDKKVQERAKRYNFTKP